MIEKILQKDRRFWISGATANGYKSIDFTTEDVVPYVSANWSHTAEFFTSKSRITYSKYAVFLGYRFTVKVEISCINQDVITKTKELIKLIGDNSVVGGMFNQPDLKIQNFVQDDLYYSKFYCKSMTIKDYDEDILIGEKYTFIFEKRNLVKSLPVYLDFLEDSDGNFIVDDLNNKITII